MSEVPFVNVNSHFNLQITSLPAAWSTVKSAPSLEANVCPEMGSWSTSEGALWDSMGGSTQLNVALARTLADGGSIQNLISIGKVDARLGDNLSGFADHQVRIYSDFGAKFFGSMEAVQNTLCRNSPHLGKRLLDRRKSRNRVGGGFNIIEADDRNIAGDTYLQVLERSNDPDRGHVVECHNRSELSVSCQQLLDHRVP